MAKKNITMEYVDTLIAKVNKTLREKLVEDEKRYTSYVCQHVDADGKVRGCGRTWALTKPAIIVNPNKSPSIITVVKCKENGAPIRDNEGEIVTFDITRRQTGCYCGRPFIHPTISVSDISGSDVDSTGLVESQITKLDNKKEE